MIKVIIFDVGGVLYSDKGWNTRENLAEKFNCDLKRFNASADKHFGIALKRNKPTFQYEISVAKDLDLDNKKLIREWQRLRAERIILTKQTENILEELKKNYFLGILTNVSPAHDIIRAKKGFYNHFKFNIKSCDLGIVKPDIKIFKHLLKELKKNKIKPEETIFIDDVEKNMPPARKLGINTILFKDNKQLIKDLRKFGVKI
jgi:putative hydrolase of the HAD superfamily